MTKKALRNRINNLTDRVNAQAHIIHMCLYASGLLPGLFDEIKKSAKDVARVDKEYEKAKRKGLVEKATRFKDEHEKAYSLCEERLQVYEDIRNMLDYAIVSRRIRNHNPEGLDPNKASPSKEDDKADLSYEERVRVYKSIMTAMDSIPRYSLPMPLPK